MPIHVVNKYKHQPTRFDVRICRGTPLGNPFTHKPLGTSAVFVVPTVQEAISKYEHYILQKIAHNDSTVIKELKRILLMSKTGDVYLVCSCSPRPCHGDVIKRILEESALRLAA